MRERQRASLLAVCLEYLERYYMLIAFASYLCSPSFNPDLPTQVRALCVCCVGGVGGGRGV